MPKRGKKKRSKQNNTKDIESEKIEVDNAEWTLCPDCGTRLKSDNLSSHLNKVHDKGIPIKKNSTKLSSRFKRPIAKKRSKNKRELSFSRKREDIIIFSVLAIIIGSIISGYYIYDKFFHTDDTFKNENSQSSINSDGQTPIEPPPDNPPPDNPPPDNGNWLESYTPEHNEGSEGNDWWINYAKTYSDRSGTPVNHPDWVKNALTEKSILIIAHSTDCVPCKVQTEDAEKLLEKYGDDLTYFDVITSSDADQDKVEDIYGIYYDPEHPMSIPLTVIITKIKGADGNIEIGWHSYAGHAQRNTKH